MKKISFWANKKIRKPTIVRFRKSDGTIAKFKATEFIMKPAKYKFNFKKKKYKMITNNQKLKVKKDRKVIKDIIYKNLKLIEMAKNKEAICQDLADAILLYFLEKEGYKNG